MATELEERLLRALETIERYNREAAAAPAVAQPPPMALTVNQPANGGLETRVALLERRVSDLESSQEKTENKSYSDLQDEMRRLKDSSSHWTRYAITAVVTLFSGGLLLWLGKLLGK